MNEASGAYANWHVASDSDRIVTLSLDKAGASTNVLSRAVLSELGQILDALAQDPGARGVIIASAKPSGFILGADIKEFAQIDSAATGAALAAEGQRLLARLERLPQPSVAAIRGFALGGGLELALACDYRVIADSFDRTLGLPEVQLGLHPGFGGTVRAVRLIGPTRALDLMLTGRNLAPREAARVGLVDRVVAPDELLDAAKRLLLERPPAHKPKLLERLLNFKPLRPLVAKRVRAAIARRANPAHYPAPYALLDLWVRHGARGEAAYAAEAESIGRLFVSDTSRNLVRVFGLRERLKSLAPKSSRVEHVHVIGAGVMGGDIASWCALRGIDVTLEDQVGDAVTAALARAKQLFTERLKAPGAAAAAAARLVADVGGDGRAKADLVIEAIVERLDVKQAVFTELEAVVAQRTVLASNTSSLRIEDIAARLQRRERVVGIHFFNPVAKLPLVEVIQGTNTDAATVARATAFVLQIDKLPLPCRSAPGFVVNRVLTPYMLEALRAHVDGHSLSEIDAAAVAFGMPVGPVELADRVGLDVALHVAKILSEVLESEPPALLAERVSQGKLGVKSGEGFYRYVDGKPQKEPVATAPRERLQDRLLLPLLNESVACIAEGVVAEADLLDAGVVFGTGFAPFRGGPLHYARMRGIDDVVATLASLAAEHGRRFQPHPGWARLGA